VTSSINAIATHWDGIVAEERRLGIDSVRGPCGTWSWFVFICDGGRAQKRWKRILRDSLWSSSSVRVIAIWLSCSYQ